MGEGRRYKICKGEPWRWGSLYNFTLLLSDASAMRFSGNALLLNRNGMIKYIRTSVDTVNLWLNGTSTCQKNTQLKHTTASLLMKSKRMHYNEYLIPKKGKFVDGSLPKCEGRF